MNVVIGQRGMGKIIALVQFLLDPVNSNPFGEKILLVFRSLFKDF